MNVAQVDRALLLARTVRHLHASQVAHRLRLRGQKVVLGRMPQLAAPLLQRKSSTDPDWPEGYTPLDGRLAEGYPSAEANAEGRFRFLSSEALLGDPADWEQPHAAQLWRYHLHYFEWAWALAAHPDRLWARATFQRLWRSWTSGTTFGRWDTWSPYVASLRSWALCGVYRQLVADSDEAASYVPQLGLHAGFVRANLELDVGGNHLIKNLKALVGLGLFLDDDRLVKVARRHLERQIAIQVLADGGHFELSPSYHCQVLGDLIDVGELLHHAKSESVTGLHEAVEAMRRWLGVMLMPDGEVPMFNDCTYVGEHCLKLLQPKPAPRRRLTVLQPSGYVVMRPDERLHLVADVGSPCPPQLPAHAHADCLSFELAVDGQRVLLNSGTSTYQPGPRRDYERSTRAHNTVEVDGHDQTEVWGTFRAGRRAAPHLESASDDGEVIEAVAFHDGYRRLPGRPLHRRSWRVTDAGVEVTDELLGSGRHQMKSTLHVAPGVPVTQTVEGFALGPLSLASTTKAQRCVLEGTEVATNFGARRASEKISMTTTAEAPSRQCSKLELCSDGPTFERAGAIGDGQGTR